MIGPARKPLLGVSLAVVVVGVLVTAILLEGTFRNGKNNEEKNTTAARSVEKRIEIMLTAAQAGDVKTFLDCFADPCLSRMKQQADAGFAERLRRSEASLQGFSRISREDGNSRREVVVLIEKVYPEHEEQYRLTLRQFGEDWKITRMEGLQKEAPRIRFGTPVFPRMKTR